MSGQIPIHIAQRYMLRARGFKQEKRQQVRELQKALDALRDGCAFLPCGSLPVDRIQREIDILREESSIKKWGR